MSLTMKFNASDLSCTFLPGKYSNAHPVPSLYNAVYHYWKKVWGDIFTQAGSPGSLNAENFLRQDFIIALHRGDEVVGILATSFFNLGAESTFDHAYMKAFPRDFVGGLHAEGRGLATTSEYLSVHPDYRRSQIGVALSDVLVGLGLKIFSQQDGTVTLGTAVRPARSHESAFKYGYVEVGTIQKYGLDCSLLFNTQDQLHRHADPDVAALVDDYWATRNDLTGLTLTSETHRRAA
jgi:hypothetical protein